MTNDKGKFLMTLLCNLVTVFNKKKILMQVIQSHVTCCIISSMFSFHTTLTKPNQLGPLEARFLYKDENPQSDLGSF